MSVTGTSGDPLATGLRTATSHMDRRGTVLPLTLSVSSTRLRMPIALLCCLLLAASCAIPDASDAASVVIPDPTVVAASDASTADGSESETAARPDRSQPGDGEAIEEPTPTVTPTPTPVPTLEPVPGFDSSVAVDPELIEGEFDNGLRYLIRENSSPGSRAELRLVIDAGSALEAEDQLGGAHFLEHMLFNGTDRFPANELGAVLEGFGMAFGADVNAYTSYDETVYALSLATDDFAVVELGLDVLQEWAIGATIDPAEVEAERGVVVEEWRLRDEGTSGRIFDVYEELLLVDTAFKDRAPIGTFESISSMETEALRRYYTDWYRPDLMTIVAVGDFDSAMVEAEIRERFEPLEPPADAPERPEFEYPALAESDAAVLIEPDLPSAYAEILFPGPSRTVTSLEQLRNDVLLDMAFEMILNRITDDISRGDSELLDVQLENIGLARPMSVRGISVESQPELVEEAAVSLFTEVELARRFGFTEAELTSVVAAARAANAQSLVVQDSKQDVEYTAELVAHALGTAPATSVEQAHDALAAVLDTIDVEAVALVLQQHLEQRPAALFVVSPEDAADAAPSRDELKDIWKTVGGLELEPRSYLDLTGASLPTIDTAADVVDRGGVESLELLDLRLENGARVLIKPTKIAENTVHFLATSPGGRSLADDAIAGESTLIGSVVANSGVGAFGAPELRQVLSGKFVQLLPSIHPTHEELNGAGATTDFEVMMQLANLYFTASRADQASFDAIAGQLRPFAESWESIPGRATEMKLAQLRHGDEPRLLPLPTTDTLDEFDLEQAHDFFIDRFDDAGDFTFIIVGDIDPGAAENLAARYLGTLPTGTTDETPRDIFGEVPAGITTETVMVGSGEQGSVTMVFEQPFVADAGDRIAVQVLENVLFGRLVRRLREGLGATYSPAIRVQLSDDVTPTITTTITVSADPEGLDQVVDETIALIADLVETGPSASSFESAIEILRLDFELVSNPFWLEELRFLATHDDADPLDATRRKQYLAAVTAAEVQSLAATALPIDNYIEIREVPAG